MAVTVDQVFDKIGSFGRYQPLLLVGLNVLVFLWSSWPVMIMTLLTTDPGWKFAANSSYCTFKDTITSSSKNFMHRCDIPRSEWKFIDDLTSVVTEVCIPQEHSVSWWMMN